MVELAQAMSMASHFSATTAWVFAQTCITMHVGMEFSETMRARWYVALDWLIAVSAEDVSIFSIDQINEPIHGFFNHCAARPEAKTALRNSIAFCRCLRADLRRSTS